MIIESDSAILVDILNKKKIIHKILQRWWPEMQSLLGFVLHCGHQFREANCIANRLANMGVKVGKYVEFYSVQNLPKDIRGWFRLERIGLPYVHSAGLY